MLIKFEPTEEQKNYAKQLVEKTNFGKRGVFDGNKYHQYVGMLGQTVVADWLNLPRPKDNGGFDGGIDFVIHDITIDLKTMTRNSEMKPHYVHNLYGAQIGYNTDVLMFAIYNKYKGTITLCGWLPKDLFKEKAKHFKENERRYRDDGTYIEVRGKHGLYEITQSELFSIPNSPKQFKNDLKKLFKKE